MLRTGASLPAYIDPHNRQFYLDDPFTDVVVGDIAGFRGVVRRVTKVPDIWTDGGMVVEFEIGPPYFPDWGVITRDATYVLDEATGERQLLPGTTVWSGPCHVANDPYGFDRLADLGEQYVTTIPFVIQIPLEVVDVDNGDIFTITSSRDLRLLVRTLTIKSARAGSDNLFRELLAFDNQGD